MHPIRMFSTDNYKGKRGYLESQKRYEIARTILYFAISLSLFIAGWVSTGKRENLLTIVAILGCLPACKSLVETILYLRFHGCKEAIADQISEKSTGLCELYDCVFTSYEKNFCIHHIVINGNTLCGYTPDKSFDEAGFRTHITDILKKDCITDVSVKIYTDRNKYLTRIEELKALPADQERNALIAETLKSVSL